LNIAVFLLLTTGLFLIFDIPFLPKSGVRARIICAAKKLGSLKLQRPMTAKDYVARINGTAKENAFIRSRKEAQSVYRKTGQSGGYRKTLRLSVAAAATGAAAGLFFRNPLLSVVLGVGLYFIPLWLTQFSLYRYNRFLNEELEVALSLVTTSYMRSSDILSAVEENLNNINSPVREVFLSFVNNLKYVDANAPAQIERMKGALDNKLFYKWCDCLILCQNDHTLKATLLPIVGNFSELKAQQLENETNMMRPLREAIFMISLTLGVIPLLRILNADWYFNLMGTFPGQVSLVVTAVAVLLSVNKAIRLSKPVEYDI